MTLPKRSILLTAVGVLAFLLAGRTFSAEKSSVASAAPCNVLGVISVDTTWGPGSCDPYIVTGSLIVNPAVTLTIQAGTRVEFTSLKALTVNGTLVARGTAGNPIVFTSNLASPAKGDWGYIYFSDTSTDAVMDGGGNYMSGSILQYATVEYAGGAGLSPNGAVRVEASSPYIDHTTVRSNKADGIVVWNEGASRLTNNTVTGNGVSGPSAVYAFGINVTSGGVLVINNNTVSGNTHLGIVVYGNGNTATLNGNVVTNNANGGIGAHSGEFTLSGNLITNNPGTGLRVSICSGCTITVSDNTITGNGDLDSFGGGIQIYPALNGANNLVMLTGNTLVGNTASQGGGIYVDIGVTVTLMGNTIRNNSALTGGGGVYYHYWGYSCSTGSVSNNLITNNTTGSANQGGGIYLENGCRPPITNNDLYGNLAAGAPNDLANGNPAGGLTLNAENNYWATTNSNAVEDHIWHLIDDGSLGLVDYSPYRTTPIGPPPTLAPTPTSAPSCYISGIISTDTIWGSGSCDPYIVTGSLIVDPAVTLTIQAGTRVEFTSLKALRVNGTLVARGTAGNPIVFTSNLASPAKGDWGYLYFSDTSVDAVVDGSGNYVSGSILQYATVEYAGGAAISPNGAVRVEASAPYIDHTTVRSNKADGIVVWNEGAPRLTNNSVTGNGLSGPSPVSASGIHVTSGGELVINANTASGNTNLGIVVYGNGNTATLNGNVVTNNANGGIGAYYDEFTISGNLITNNPGTGLTVSSCSGCTITVSDNTITGNGDPDTVGGGLQVAFNGTTNAVMLTGNTLTGNTASQGGGVYVHNGAMVTLMGNTIRTNSALTGGGGVYYRYSGSFICSTGSVSNNLITNNTAGSANQGGGIYLENGCRPPITNNDLYGNLAAGAPNDLATGNLAGSPTLNAENNYWGTSICNDVEAQVWHFMDDASLGIVDYVPCHTGPNPTFTPTPTPTMSPTPSNTPTASNTPTPTSTPTPSPSPTPTTTPAARLMFPMLIRNYPPCFPNLVEVEPNDSSGQANGPVCFGGDYAGYHDDADDYFLFTLSAGGSFTITLTSSASDTQLLVYHQFPSNLVAHDADAPYTIVCPLGPQGYCSGAAGTYYVRVFTGPTSIGHPTPYTLRVTYP